MNSDHRDMTITFLQEPRFKMGDIVRKKGNKGQWHGIIVGAYKTKITSIGYAVESIYESHSVQIYPESALEPLEAIRLFEVKQDDNSWKEVEMKEIKEGQEFRMFDFCGDGGIFGGKYFIAESNPCILENGNWSIQSEPRDNGE